MPSSCFISPKRTGKAFAKPLSWLAGSRFFYRPGQMLDTYWNCLIRNGSGGWNLQDELQAAVRRIRQSTVEIRTLDEIIIEAKVSTGWTT